MGKGVFCVIFFVVVQANGNSYDWGSCPIMTPMPDFNMERMLGVWYVIQQTSTSSTCMTYNFTKSSEPYEYNLEQVGQYSFLGLTFLKHEYKYQGRLIVPDDSVPARMKVEFARNILGKADFTIFMTDYDTYGALYTCQGLGIAHRESVSILSRTQTPDPMLFAKALPPVRTKLISHNINPFELSTISHKDCGPEQQGGVTVNINQNTITTQVVSVVVYNEGEHSVQDATPVYSQLSQNDENQGGKIEDGTEHIPAQTLSTLTLTT